MKNPSTSSIAPDRPSFGGNRIEIWTAALIVSALPAVLTWALVRFWLNSDLNRYVPSSWNDMTDYWHETLSYLRVGFQSGFYGVNELGSAPISFFHFDAHGPFYPVLFGNLARITGWEFDTAIYINMIFLALGMLAFFLIIRADIFQILGTACVTLAVFPVLMYVPTNSQEPFHQMGAFIAAGIFYRLLRFRRENPGAIPPRIPIVASLGFLLLMMCIRLSWGLLLLPFFALLTRREWKVQILGVTTATLYIILGYGVMWAVSPPQGSNHTLMLIAQGFKTSPGQGLRTIQTLVNYNVKYALEWPWTVNVTFFGVCSLLLVVLIVRFWRKAEGKPLALLKSGRADELLLHIFNLVTVLGMTFTVYLVENAGRVLGVHLLISLLIMLAFRQYRFLSLVVGLCILLLPWNLADYRMSWKGNYIHDPQALSAARLELSKVAGYDENAASPWCNSMLIPLDMYDYRATVIPAGLGIQFYLRRMPMQVPLKSHYIYMDDPNLALLQEKIGKLPLEPLQILPYGTVYRNMDADCDPGSLEVRE